MATKATAQRTMLKALGCAQVFLGICITVLLGVKTMDYGSSGGVKLLYSGLWTGPIFALVGFKTVHTSQFTSSSPSVLRALMVCEHGNLLATVLACLLVLKFGLFSPESHTSAIVFFVCAVLVCVAATLYASNIRTSIRIYGGPKT